MTVILLHGTIVKPRPECSHRSCEKSPSLPGFAPHSCQIKDSFQSSKAGLFTSNNANETEVRASKMKKRPCIRTSRQDGRCGQCDLSILQRESEICWLLWPVDSQRPTSCCHCVFTSHRHSEKKGNDVWESAHSSAAGV